MRYAITLFALLAACSSTTKDIRSGRAWRDAKPADYRATKEQVLAEVEKFMVARNFRITYSEDRSLVKGYMRGDNPTEQNIELHVRVEASPGEGMTRVTAISGRSLGIEWKGREHHERLHGHLRAAFSGS